jgi:tRNA modification GTPase
VSDTIFAVATGRGKAGLSVIRVSGPEAASALTSFGMGALEPRRAALRTLIDRDGLVIDQALCLWFPGPASFTGEDTLEIHCHGAISVVSLILERLGLRSGFRLARPGEFSRRALDNGRMDLTEAEGLVDLIDSETEQQRQQAIRMLMGGLSREIDRWRSELVGVLALFEAQLDFSDEGDVDSGVLKAAEHQLSALREHMAHVLASSSQGERLREGLTIVLAGAPNVGKSTLLNILAQRDVAIVSSIPGTTRDIVEARLDLGGYPVTLLDTAGLRASSDPIEQEGVKRMLARASVADLIIWLQKAGDPDTGLPEDLKDMPGVVIRVITHIDLYPKGDDGLGISSLTGEGIEELISVLTKLAEDRMGRSNDRPVLTRARQREAVSEALESIDRALAILHSAGTELIVEEVRMAMRAIARVTGHVGVDDILDQLFSQFCIGK